MVVSDGLDDVWLYLISPIKAAFLTDITIAFFFYSVYRPHLFGYKIVNLLFRALMSMNGIEDRCV